MLMNQLPFVASLLKAVGLACEKALGFAILEYDIHFLNCADDTHAAVPYSFHFEDVDLARTETAECPVECRPTTK